MFNKIISFLYKLTYYFTSPVDIELDQEDHHDYDLTDRRLTHMYDITKYFIWRKYTLYLAIPFLLTNIILNIVNYHNIKENIEYYQNETIKTYDLGNIKNDLGNINNDLGNIRNDTQHFIQLLNSGKTMDYILFYNVFSTVCISIELLLLCLAIYKNRIWYTSKKILNYYAWFSYFWIYIIYINPVIDYFKLEYNHNTSITNQNYLYSYSFTYILYKLLKEILPLSLCFFTSFLWSVSNVKCLFPNSIYVGYLYTYVNTIFFITSGTLLLVINQLMSNTLFSAGVGIFISGLYISNYVYGRRLKYFYRDSNDLGNYNFKLNFIKNLSFSIYFVLGIGFIWLYDNPLTHGIYKFYKTDIAYFITKIIYKVIFYKVWCSDVLISWILNTEKYRDIYKIELQDFCDKMKYIERQLYEDKYN